MLNDYTREAVFRPKNTRNLWHSESGVSFREWLARSGASGAEAEQNERIARGILEAFAQASRPVDDRNGGTR